MFSTFKNADYFKIISYWFHLKTIKQQVGEASALQTFTVNIIPDNVTKTSTKSHYWLWNLFLTTICSVFTNNDIQYGVDGFKWDV